MRHPILDAMGVQYGKTIIFLRRDFAPTFKYHLKVRMFRVAGTQAFSWSTRLLIEHFALFQPACACFTTKVSPQQPERAAHCSARGVAECQAAFVRPATVGRFPFIKEAHQLPARQARL